MIPSTKTIYACFTWVKPANRHPERRWEINLLEHKEKLLCPVTWNGFHSAYTSLSSLRKTADIRHQHRGILTHSPGTSVDSAGSVVYCTLIFIICSQSQFSYKWIKWQYKLEANRWIHENISRKFNSGSWNLWPTKRISSCKMTYKLLENTTRILKINTLIWIKWRSTSNPFRHFNVSPCIFQFNNR